MGPTKLPPHLVRDRNLKRCSVCGESFTVDAQPSLSKAFVEHVKKVHRSLDYEDSASTGSAPDHPAKEKEKKRI